MNVLFMRRLLTCLVLELLAETSLAQQPTIQPEARPINIGEGWPVVRPDPKRPQVMRMSCSAVKATLAYTHMSEFGLQFVYDHCSNAKTWKTLTPGQPLGMNNNRPYVVIGNDGKPFLACRSELMVVMPFFMTFLDPHDYFCARNPNLPEGAKEAS